MEILNECDDVQPVRNQEGSEAADEKILIPGLQLQANITDGREDQSVLDVLGVCTLLIAIYYIDE